MKSGGVGTRGELPAGLHPGIGAGAIGSPIALGGRHTRTTTPQGVSDRVRGKNVVRTLHKLPPPRNRRLRELQQANRLPRLRLPRIPGQRQRRPSPRRRRRLAILLYRPIRHKFTVPEIAHHQFMKLKVGAEARNLAGLELGRSPQAGSVRSSDLAWLVTPQVLGSGSAAVGQNYRCCTTSSSRQGVADAWLGVGSGV